MATRICPACGTPIPGGSTFCERCGSRIPAVRPERIVGRYTALRFQVDPIEPPPERDIRWPILVLGVCSLVVSGVLLTVYALVNGATAGSELSCGSGSASPCASAVVEYVFLVPGLALLAVGVVAVVAVLLEIW